LCRLEQQRSGRKKPRDAQSLISKKSHHAWYYNVNGRPVRLASEADGEQAAYKEYDRLMAGRQPIRNDSPVVGLLERFLERFQKRYSAI
jgi:hypothetical protein